MGRFGLPKTSSYGYISTSTTDNDSGRRRPEKHHRRVHRHTPYSALSHTNTLPRPSPKPSDDPAISLAVRLSTAAEKVELSASDKAKLHRIQQMTLSYNVDRQWEYYHPTNYAGQFQPFFPPEPHNLAGKIDLDGRNNLAERVKRDRLRKAEEKKRNMVLKKATDHYRQKAMEPYDAFWTMFSNGGNHHSNLTYQDLPEPSFELHSLTTIFTVNRENYFRLVDFLDFKASLTNKTRKVVAEEEVARWQPDFFHRHIAPSFTLASRELVLDASTNITILLNSIIAEYSQPIPRL